MAGHLIENRSVDHPRQMMQARFFVEPGPVSIPSAPSMRHFCAILISCSCIYAARLQHFLSLQVRVPSAKALSRAVNPSLKSFAALKRLSTDLRLFFELFIVSFDVAISVASFNAWIAS